MHFFKQNRFVFVMKLLDSVVMSGWGFSPLSLHTAITFILWYDFLFTYDFSSSVGAWILMWVPSIHPITFGNPPREKNPVLILYFSDASQGHRINLWEMSTIASVTSETTRLTVDLSTPMQSPIFCKKLPLAKNRRVMRTCWVASGHSSSLWHVAASR